MVATAAVFTVTGIVNDLTLGAILVRVALSLVVLQVAYFVLLVLRARTKRDDKQDRTFGGNDVEDGRSRKVTSSEASH
ncbi:hypothetical protein [Pseudoruegeria sp. HB172150]|uniref:hypothetical protein n=1 Tax=Pseudoruegeria sp. HB172150 TaxID=2721164 RepID=UPI001C132922|nr:hypothetical protein [Pseudoruegeria sp. HB172150]